MNFIRAKQKNISLSSIDYKGNVKDYNGFNYDTKKKNEIELEKELNDFSTKNYFAIVENETHKFVGMVGFKNLIQSNQRTNIDLILSDELEEEKRIEYGSEALKMISNYSFDTINLHNLLCEESDLKSCNMYIDAGYEYIGTRHVATLEGDTLKDLHFFQKLPYFTKRKDSIVVPKNTLTFRTNGLSISELPKIVNNLNVTLIRPEELDDKTLSFVKEELGKSLNDNYDASAMGEYKTIYNDFRLNKKLYGTNTFDYLILDETSKPIGYVDRLHIDNKNFRTDVEINIFSSSSRNKGYGSDAYKLYVRTLRSMGYVSIGSVVFDFNKPSINMHERIGFNEYALRDESYFAFGKLNDMHYYEASFEEELEYKKECRK